MKKLFLLRHAEAGPSPDGQDKTRPLTPKGSADALALGSAMAARHYRPDTVLCSSAVRTRQTCNHVLKTLGETINTGFSDNLYNAPRGSLFAAIQDAGNAYDTILLIAHNPGIHELAVTLAAQNASADTNRLMSSGYAPGTLCALECPCESWHDIQPAGNKVLALLEPRDYNAPATPARWM